MKRLLLALMVALFAYPATAAMNLRQNPDGTADWVGARDDTHLSGPVGNCVGAARMGGDVELSKLITYRLVSPITNAVIRDVQVALPFVFGSGQTARVTVYAGSQTTWPLGFLSGTTVVHGNIFVHGRGPGVTFNISRPTDLGPTASFISHTVMRGDPISIQSNGGATTRISAHVLVTLCPR